MARLAFIPLTTSYDDPSIVPSEVALVTTNELLTNEVTGAIWYKNNVGQLLDVFYTSWTNMMATWDEPLVNVVTDPRFADLTAYIDARVNVNAGGAALTSAMNSLLHGLTNDTEVAEGKWGNAVNLIPYIRSHGMGDLSSSSVITDPDSWGSIGGGKLKAFIYKTIADITNSASETSDTVLGGWMSPSMRASTKLQYSTFEYLKTLTNAIAVPSYSTVAASMGWGYFPALKAYVWNVLNSFPNSGLAVGASSVGGWGALTTLNSAIDTRVTTFLDTLTSDLALVTTPTIATKWANFENLDKFIQTRVWKTMGELGGAVADDDAGTYVPASIDNWGDFGSLKTWLDNSLAVYAAGSTFKTALGSILDALAENPLDVADNWGSFTHLRGFVYNAIASFVDGTTQYTVRGSGLTNTATYRLDAANGFAAGIARALANYGVASPTVNDSNLYLPNLEVCGRYSWDTGNGPTTGAGRLGVFNTDANARAFYVRVNTAGAGTHLPTVTTYDTLNVLGSGRIKTYGGIAVYTNGNGYGTFSEAATFSVSAAGAVSALSYATDSKREIKENIVPCEKDALAIINSVDVCEYTFKADPTGDVRVGFIADDTDPVLSGSNQDKFDLNNVIGVMMKAIQQLTEKVAVLEAKLAENGE
jgi:hypothetical protein